VIVDSGQQSR